LTPEPTAGDAKKRNFECRAAPRCRDAGDAHAKKRVRIAHHFSATLRTACAMRTLCLLKSKGRHSRAPKKTGVEIGGNPVIEASAPHQNWIPADAGMTELFSE
jgi:hypothetical protein